ncbi:MAG: hypothetical protein P8Z41_02035 [Anaerolineales bacterium]
MRHGLAGLGDDPIGLTAGGKCDAVIGVSLDEIRQHAIDGLPGDLRSARVIEIDRTFGQRRKVCAAGR